MKRVQNAEFKILIWSFIQWGNEITSNCEKRSNCDSFQFNAQLNLQHFTGIGLDTNEMIEIHLIIETECVDIKE